MWLGRGDSSVDYWKQKCSGQLVYCSYDYMAHAQKPDFVFRRNGRVHVTWRGRQFSRLLAAQVCGSAGSVCTVLERVCSAVLVGTHSILLFPQHFPSHATPCGMSFYRALAFVLCWRGYAPRSCQACRIPTPFSCCSFIPLPRVDVYHVILIVL
jgi:hypothetical protein